MKSQCNINELNYAVEHGIIDMTGVLESTNEMRKQEILKEHGDLIKQYGHGKEKYWYFRIPDSTQENGCFRRRSKSREHIENELCKYYINIEEKKQKFNQKENMTLEALFYEFMEHKKEKVGSGTIKRMVADWKKFYEPHPEFVKKPYREITKIDVDNFFNGIINQNMLKDKAFSNMCGILKQIFEYAVDAEYIDKSPYRVEVNKKKIIPTRKKPSEKEVFSLKEQELIINEMEHRLEMNPSNTVPFAIMLDFEIGVRCGEMLALKESDIVVENGIYKIHVCRQLIKENDITDLKCVKGKGWHIVDYTKSDCGDRLIPLTEKAREYIERIKQTNRNNGNLQGDYLFVTKDGKIITEDAVSGQLKRGCQKVGIPVRRMHKIRKTYASTLYRRGVPIPVICKLLGHADESTTMKHYIFSVDDTEETDALVLNALQGTETQHTISSEESAKSVTNGDRIIIQFPVNKKAENPRKLKVSH